MVNVSFVGTVATAFESFVPFPFSPGFDIQKIVQFTENLPTHSWEYGTYTEALLEIYNPELSVFGDSPFPVPSFDKDDVKALTYLQPRVALGEGYAALDRGNGCAGDPASMGIGAVLIGRTIADFANATAQTVDGLLHAVPRASNGAISHRADIAEVWADFMSMVPPFLAYYAADKQDPDLLKESYSQCGLYRQLLQSKSDDQFNNAWHHIIGPESQDLGLWSTGNAWAANGMVRVLATIMKSSWIQASWKDEAIDLLGQYIKEIVDVAVQAPLDEKLLRNYLNNWDVSNGGFGEISGSTLIAASIYRMAVLQPGSFGQTYIDWADGIRLALSGLDSRGALHITPAGVVTPAINPLAWKDPVPYTAGSPEGNSFVILLYAGWRDCVSAEKCITAGISGSDTSSSSPQSQARPTNMCPNGRAQMLSRRATMRKRSTAHHFVHRRHQSH